MGTMGRLVMFVLTAYFTAVPSLAATGSLPTATRTPIVDTRPTSTPIVDTRPTRTPIVDTRPTSTPIVDTRPTRTPIPDTRPTATPIPATRPTRTPIAGREGTYTATPTPGGLPPSGGLGILLGQCSISSTESADGTFNGLVTLRVTNVSGVSLTSVVATELQVDGEPGAVFEVTSGPVPAGGQPRLQAGSSAIFRYMVQTRGRVSLGAGASATLPGGDKVSAGPFDCGSLGASVPVRTPGGADLIGSCVVSSTENADGSVDGLVTLHVTNTSGADLTNVTAGEISVHAKGNTHAEVVSGPVPARGISRIHHGSTATFRYVVRVDGSADLRAGTSARRPDGSTTKAGPFSCGTLSSPTQAPQQNAIALVGNCAISSTKNSDGTFEGLVTFRVTNTSGANLTNVTASDLLVDAGKDAQFELVSGPVPAGGQPRLQEGSSVNFRYRVRVVGQASLRAEASATLPDKSTASVGPISCGTIGEPPLVPVPGAVGLEGLCSISSTENQDGTTAGLITLRIKNVSGVDLTNVTASQLQVAGAPAVFQVTSGPVPAGGQPRLQNGSTAIFRYMVRVDGLASLTAEASGTLPGGGTTSGGPFACGSIGKAAPVRTPGAADLVGSCTNSATRKQDGTYEGLILLRVTNVSGVDLTKVMGSELNAQGDPGAVYNVTSGPVPAGGQSRLQDGSSSVFRYRVSVVGRVGFTAEASATLPDGSSTAVGPFDCGAIGETAPAPEPGAADLTGSCAITSTKNQDGTFNGLVTFRATNTSGVDLTSVKATDLTVDATGDTEFETTSGPVPAGGQSRLQDGSTVIFRYRVHVNGYASLSAETFATLPDGSTTTAGPFACGTIGEVAQPVEPGAAILEAVCSTSSTKNHDGTFNGLVTLRVTNTSGVTMTDVKATALTVDAAANTEFETTSGPVPAGGQPRLQSGSTVIFRYLVHVNGYASLSAQAAATLPGGSTTAGGPFACGTIGELPQPVEPGAAALEGVCSTSSTKKGDGTFDGLVTLRVTNTSAVNLTSVMATPLNADKAAGTEFEVTSGPVPAGGQPRLQNGSTVIFRYRVHIDGYASLSAAAIAAMPGGSIAAGGPYSCGTIGEVPQPSGPVTATLEGVCSSSSTKNHDGTYDSYVTLRVTNTSTVDLTDVIATPLNANSSPGTEIEVTSGPVPAGGQPRLQSGSTVTFRYRVHIAGYASLSARAFATVPGGSTAIVGPFECGTIGEPPQPEGPVGVAMEGVCSISSTKNHDGTFDGLVTLRVTNTSGVNLTNVMATPLDAGSNSGTRFEVTSGPVPATGQARLQNGSTVIFRYRVHISGSTSLSARSIATLPSGSTVAGGPFVCGTFGG
jgi:hypothetical protein